MAKIVVTGATGNVGRALVHELLAAGDVVTAVARHLPEGSAQPGVLAVQADLAQPATLLPAFVGAEALFLLVAGDQPQAVLSLAREAGVQRVVLLSTIGAGTRPEAYQQAVAFEAAVRASGLAWTILRSGGMAANALAWSESIRSERTAAAPFGDVGLPFVDPADVAAAAAVVLRGHGHSSRTYDLTGPATVSPRQRAQVIADALGEPVRFVEQSAAEARAEMLRFMPAAVVEGTLAILGSPLPAEQRVSPDTATLLGRQPRSFADWVASSLGAFR